MTNVEHNKLHNTVFLFSFLENMHSQGTIMTLITCLAMDGNFAIIQYRLNINYDTSYPCYL